MPPPPSVQAKLVAEFVGTFFLTLTISLTVQNVALSGSSSSIHPGLVIGLVLTGLIFAFGQYSQAHFNPTVSFVISCCFKPNNRLTDKMLMSKSLALFYVVVQVAASISAGALGIYLSPLHISDEDRLIIRKNNGTEKMIAALLPFAKPITDTTHHIWKAWVAELFWTFLLVIVILCVGFSGRQKGNHFFGFAIGMIVTGGIVCTGAVSGAAFNPAVATGLAVSYCFTKPTSDETSCGPTALKYLWIYWTACPLGGALAAAVNAVLMTTENNQDDADDDDHSPEEMKKHSQQNAIPQSPGCVIECKTECVDDDPYADDVGLLRKRKETPENGNEDNNNNQESSSAAKSGKSSCKNQVCDLPGIGKVKKVRSSSMTAGATTTPSAVEGESTNNSKDK